MHIRVQVIFYCSIVLAILQPGLPLKCYNCYGGASCARTPGAHQEEECDQGYPYACRWSFNREDNERDNTNAGSLFLRGCQDMSKLGLRNETWCSSAEWDEDCYCHEDFCNGEMVQCSIRETNKDAPGSCKQ